MKAFALDETYVQLLDGGSAETIEVDARFWEEIDRREDLHAGRLVCLFPIEGEGDHSEMHPAGDELLVGIAGEIEVVLEGDRDERIVLTSGRAVLVPRGTWHHLNAKRGSVLLSITPGSGTDHRAISR